MAHVEHLSTYSCVGMRWRAIRTRWARLPSQPREGTIQVQTPHNSAPAHPGENSAKKKDDTRRRHDWLSIVSEVKKNDT